MKSIRRKTLDTWLTIGVGIAMVFLPWMLCQLFPTWSFRLLTGRKIPPNVKVLDYESRFTDNFFYRSSFWLLQGNAADLAKVVEGGLFGVWGKAPFTEQDEALYSLPDAGELFRMDQPEASLSTVYLQGESGVRSPAYWIFDSKQKAIFRD